MKNVHNRHATPYGEARHAAARTHATLRHNAGQIKDVIQFDNFIWQ